MKRKLIATVGFLTMALAAPAYAGDTRLTSSTASTSDASRPRAVGVPRGTSLGSSADEAKYAAREAASPDAKKYRGGDVIVISVTAVAIILLVVIIIILI